MGHSIKFLILTLFFVVAANGQNKLNSENSLAKNILSPLTGHFRSETARL